MRRAKNVCGITQQTKKGRRKNAIVIRDFAHFNWWIRRARSAKQQQSRQQWESCWECVLCIILFFASSLLSTMASYVGNFIQNLYLSKRLARVIWLEFCTKPSTHTAHTFRPSPQPTRIVCLFMYVTRTTQLYIQHHSMSLWFGANVNRCREKFLHFSATYL